MKYKLHIKDDFKNLLDYQNWVNYSFERLSPKNENQKERFTKRTVEKYISKYKNWFGDGATYKELAEGVKDYKDPELLERLYQKVNHSLSPVVAQNLKARKLKFNALGFGMFCFDRASMTLYKAKESETAETYKIKTNTKELFAYFPEVSREKHAVEFFISSIASAYVKAEEILYGGVSAVIMAELLAKAGIKVKINIVIGSAIDKERKEFVGCIVPVKNFDEPVDRNVLALLSSDPRFMRFDSFKGIVSAFEYFDREAPVNLGYSANAEQFKTLVENSGYTTKLQSKHRFYFGGTFTEDEALNDINNTIETISEFLKQ